MSSFSLSELGWKPVFQQQLTLDELETGLPGRIYAVHKGAIALFTEAGPLELPRQLFNRLPDVTVGDWLLLSSDDNRPARLLDRSSVIRRKAAGQQHGIQLIAANIDVLLIVSSCNRDFNPARLERYLALAYESGAVPVVVLTKADLCDDADVYLEQAKSLHTGLPVELVNALDTHTLAGIRALCKPGTTLAMVGSSGVGKSTLANALGEGNLATAPIREDDAKGRHTTTARSMHPIINGSLLIDMPGMREIQLTDCETGLDELFDDLRDLGQCRFSDCTHTCEPGCVVLAAVESGRIEQRRLDSHHKLLREQRRNTETLAEQHKRMKKFGRMYKSVIKEKKEQRESDT